MNSKSFVRLLVLILIHTISVSVSKSNACSNSNRPASNLSQLEHNPVSLNCVELLQHREKRFPSAPSTERCTNISFVDVLHLEMYAISTEASDTVCSDVVAMATLYSR